MNAVHLTGRLTRDPELRTTNNGNYVCQFTIAVNRKRAGADGEKIADFINCVAWRKTAEVVAKYLTKGKMVAVNGELHSRTYEKDGRKNYVLEVVCDEYGGVEFLTPKGESAGNTQSEAAAAAYSPAQTDEQSGYVKVDEDELPF